MDRDKIKVIHELIGHTLTVWLDDPARESIRGNVSKSKSGRGSYRVTSYCAELHASA
jgi:hypothetical protein